MRKFLTLWLLPIAVAAVAALALYMSFGGRVCDVSGGSMSPALTEGQRVWISRQDGYGRYDMVALRHPYARRGCDSLTFKRIVGLPGDTVLLREKRLYVNGKLQNSDFCMFDRRVMLLSDAEVDAASLYGIHATRADGYVKVAVTEGIYRKMLSDSLIQNISTDMTPHELYDRCLFPFSSYYHWNKDFYGPFVVPRRGMSIDLTVGNYVAYKHLIERYEGLSVQWQEGVCRVGGKAMAKYVFRRDYCFLLNDYRDDPSDSRTFGPVPVDMMIGKVKTLKK